MLMGPLARGASAALLVAAATGCVIRPTPNPLAPYPSSRVITAARWDLSTVPSLRSALGSDLWPTAWAADGNLYTAWGDGGGFDGSEVGRSQGKASLGFARITGMPTECHPASYVGRNVWGALPFAENQATFGGKVADLFAVDGTLYGQGGLWTAANCNCKDPTQKGDSGSERTLVWSSNLGRTWQIAPWTTATDLGSALQFGPDYSGALDPAHVYFYYQRDVYSDSTHVYLRRVRRGELKVDPAAAGHFEHFAGLNADSVPTWSGTESEAVAVFADPRIPRGVHAGVSVVYNSALGRYVLSAFHGELTGQIGVFEGPTPWGPWATVDYYDDWGGFNESAREGNGMQFPAKWISADGRTLWVVFSGLRTSDTNYFDSFNLAKVVVNTSRGLTRIETPATGSFLTPGQVVTARGGGRNLSWSITRSSGEQGRIAGGSGPSLRFMVSADPGESIRITLTGHSGSVFRDYPVHAPQ